MSETRVEATLEDVAHGGTVVARIDGKATFVTGGLPGERVLVEIREEGKRFDRGTVVEVLDAHPGRIPAPCPVARVCGGCDWQHAGPELQRELKRRVVAEQLRRLAGVEWEGQVQAVDPLWGWRTRMDYRVSDGRLGLLAGRSHDVVALPQGGCPIAAGAEPDVPAEASRVRVTEAIEGRTVIADGEVLSGPAVVTEEVSGRRYEVPADGFWQVHPAAAGVLVDAVRRAVRPQPWEDAVDLYCGVGLFAGALQDDGCRVLGVEVDRRAVAHARRNVPGAHFQAASVDRFLSRLPKRTDIVVLDPPRKGAGRTVVEAVAGMRPGRVCYVACDPAALARDLAYFAERGYAPTSIEAFDLFPQTHHVECVAALHRV